MPDSNTLISFFFFLFMIAFYFLQARKCIVDSEKIKYKSKNFEPGKTITLSDLMIGKHRDKFDHYYYFAAAVLIPFAISLLPFLLSTIIFGADTVVSIAKAPEEAASAAAQVGSQVSVDKGLLDAYLFVTVVVGAYMSILITIEFGYLYYNEQIHKNLQRLLIIALILDTITFTAVVVVGIGIEGLDPNALQIPNEGAIWLLGLTSMAALLASTVVIVAVRTDKDSMHV